MQLPYEVFIGLRYLRAKRRNRTISFNTLISIAGVTIGVAALIGLILAVVMPSTAFLSGGIRDGAFKGIFTEKNAGARNWKKLNERKRRRRSTC